MSSTHFVEALSADPFIKETSRRAIRILNDQSITREQRERLIRGLQQQLLEHQVQEATKLKKATIKATKSRQKNSDGSGQVQADASQVVARTRDLWLHRKSEKEVIQEHRELVVTAANDSVTLVRRRPMLTLNQR